MLRARSRLLLKLFPATVRSGLVACLVAAGVVACVDDGSPGPLYGSTGGWTNFTGGAGGKGGFPITGFGGSAGRGGSGAGGATGPQPAFGVTVRAANTPAPVTGGTLRLSRDEAKLFVADADRGRVSVIDLTSHLVVRTFELEPTDEPSRIVEGEGNQIHVVLRRGGGIATLDLATGAILRRAVCSAPRGLAFDVATSRLYVACADGTLGILNKDGSARAVTLDPDLRDVMVTNDRLLVSTFRRPTLLTCDKDGNVLGRSRPPRATLASLKRDAFDSTLAWRTDMTPEGHVVMLHQRATNGVVVTKRPGGYGSTSTSVPCNGIVHTAVTTFDDDTRQANATSLPLGEAVVPVDFAYLPDLGGYAVVAAGNAHTSALPTIVVVPGAGSGMQPVSGDTVSLTTGTGRPGFGGQAGGQGGQGGGQAGGQGGGQGGGGGSGGGGGPGGAGGDGSGGRAAAGGRTSVDPGTQGSAGRTGSISTACLDAFAINIFAHDEPVAVAYSRTRKLLLVQSREPAEVQLFTLSGSSGVLQTTIRLDGDSVADTGHAIFHSNAGTFLACASCHGEGGEDAHVWTFDNSGARRTQSLRGGVKGTEPFHWDGDMKDMDMIMDKVFVGRMSGPSLTADQKSALGAFVDAIPAWPTSVPKDAEAVARGKALFEDNARTGCATCHAGTLLTNNATVSVGTTGSFQVPSLRGVSFRPPLMHDGCAATLADRFDPTCGGSMHGMIDQLSAQDRFDLVSYLQTL